VNDADAALCLTALYADLTATTGSPVT